MEKLQIPEIIIWLLPLIIFLAIWEAVWKLIALWKAARNGHKAWFICIAIFNTIALLPIIYIAMHSKKDHKKSVAT